MQFVRYGAAACALLLAAPAFAADANHGKTLFTACFACHTERPDALGPSLKGVVGRKAAWLQDFRYSPAMTRSGLTWTEANLKDYLRDPQGKVKGNRMPFSGYPNATDVDDVVAYLVTLK
ncbi:MAG: c-type cytochrome [Alphaproteobacteria bacterium]|nr:c-type cytochrome [Alphaproteobacteria bacterium]